MSSFPPPPPYYTLFRSDSEVQPPEPPLPVEGDYMMFGQVYTVMITCNMFLLTLSKTKDVLPPLENEGRQQLYPKDSFSTRCSFTLIYFTQIP